MAETSVVGFLVVGLLLVATTFIVSRVQEPQRVRRLLVLGLWLRVAGSFFYLFAMEGYYGRGDYDRYYREGLQYLWTLENGSLEAILDPWFQDGWWGTSATSRVTGIVFYVIGPTLQGTFVVFALLGYAGLVALWLAYKRVFPNANHYAYLAWLVFFPSLWFWPTAIGKDALVLCGVGLGTLGFAGRAGRKNWLLIAAGLFLVFLPRPQVAAVLVFAAMVGQWISISHRTGSRRFLQGLLIGAIGLWTIGLSSGAMGVELFDPDEVGDYLEAKAQVSATGGSSFRADSAGSSRWMAPINTLFRPLPWEAGGLTGAVAAIEVVLMWAFAYYRRRRIRWFFGSYRGQPLFWMAVVFVSLYSVALGMAVSNIGIIARQRIHILPFVFMFFAGPLARRTRRRRGDLRRDVATRRSVALQSRRFRPRAS